MKKFKYTISTRGYYRQDFTEEFDLYSDDYYLPESFQNIVSKTFAEVYVNEYADYPRCDSGNLIFEVLRILKEKYRFTSEDDRFVATYRLKSDININAIDNYIKNELDCDESELDEDTKLFFKHLKELINKEKINYENHD